jgi:hypothetical protein
LPFPVIWEEVFGGGLSFYLKRETGVGSIILVFELKTSAPSTNNGPYQANSTQINWRKGKNNYWMLIQSKE